MIIELFLTSLMWIVGGIIFFWVGALLFYPSKALYLIVRAFTNSSSLEEWKAKRHTHKLYMNVAATNHPVPSIKDFARTIAQRLRHTPDATYTTLASVAIALYEWERFDDPLPEPPPVANSVEGGRYRDWISKHSAKHTPQAVAAIEKIILNMLLDLAAYLPHSKGNDLTVRLVDVLPDINERVEAVALPFFDPEAIELGIFTDLRTQLNRNLHEASRIPYQPQNYDSPKLIMPSKYTGEDVVRSYLKHTPLMELFDAEVGYSIPQEARYQSQFILATQGAGKSVYLEYQISQLIPHVVNGTASIIVMDSQNTIIPKLMRLAILREHMVWIDAEDVEYPVSISMFDLGMTQNLTLLQKEQQYNSALSLCMFIFDALGSDLTSKQSVPFRFLVSLCLAIPHASLLTFKDILDNGAGKYQEYVDTLDLSAQDFFNKRFDSKEFKGTRTEIGWRIDGVLAIPTLKRILTSDRTKCDLFAEMNDPKGKIILINTARSTLQLEGCMLYGRLWLALIAMASERRFSITNPTPCHIFVDEVDDYLNKQSSASIETIVQKTRKRNVALTVACRTLSELSASTRDTLQTSAIKCVASLTDTDARDMGPGMHVKPHALTKHPVGTFSVYVRNVTPSAISTTVPYGVLDSMARMTDEEYGELKQTMREKYATKNTPTPEGADVGKKKHTTTISQQPPQKEAVEADELKVAQPVPEHQDRTTILPPEQEYPKPQAKKKNVQRLKKLRHRIGEHRGAW